MSDKVSVKTTAKLLGKSEMWVRIGMQRNLIDIGTAFKLKEGRFHKYTYDILVAKLAAHMGRPVEYVEAKIEELEA